MQTIGNKVNVPDSQKSDLQVFNLIFVTEYKTSIYCLCGAINFWRFR